MIPRSDSSVPQGTIREIHALVNARLHNHSVSSIGFTLVEMMVVLALIGILLALAVPSFSQLVQSTTISNATNTFLSDMRLARSEAIRRGGAVVICRSDSPEAPNATCSTNLGSGGTGWASGWIVFQDLDNNGMRDAAEPILRVQAPMTSVNAITDDNLYSTRFRFTATGRLANTSSTATLVFGARPLFPSTVQRTVCIGLGGRARTVGDGATTCAGSI